MGDFNVHQRTSDGMFNATELVKQWNEKNKRKDISEFLSNKNTLDFLEALILEENHNTGIPVFKTHTVSKGKNGGTWMHPILFIDFAMWINPKFKFKVLKFVYDELIKYRHDAGDNYKLLTHAIAKIVTKPFLPIAIQNIAKAINFVVFNKDIAGIRNTEASETSLRELSSLQLKISELIEEGFITIYDQLLAYIRKRWNNKHNQIIKTICIIFNQKNNNMQKLINITEDNWRQVVRARELHLFLEVAIDFKDFIIIVL
jgi:hypothetical protein